MGKVRRGLLASLVAVGLLVTAAAPALADHTNPRQPLSSTSSMTQQFSSYGEGDWEFITNFRANPGTDIKFFRKRGQLYAAAGTLGQANFEHVGQRIIRLVNRKGQVRPKWVADHGSANCPTANPAGTTGLQHDQILTPKRNPLLLIDATDANGRCHDPGGGGLEIVNVRKLHRPKFKPREVHLTRHFGTSHTVTLDARRPWIVYSNSSQSSGAPWIDVLNIKSCLKNREIRLRKRRAQCRPKVYRIPFKPEWAQRLGNDDQRDEGTEAACHDVTSTRNYRLYCANLNSTIVLDVRNLTRADGSVRGQPIKCEVVEGTRTKAKVTDCAAPVEGEMPVAKGWRYLGHVNHSGRPVSNWNLVVPSREGIAVAHEAEPTPDHKWMFVTDERGGGVVPPDAACTGSPSDIYSNGGVHVFNLQNFPNVTYAKQPDGSKAVFIGEVHQPSETFCTAHVMEHVPGEQRFTIAWYSQGTKIVDYFINDKGEWTFRETASIIPAGANTWVGIPFKIKRSGNKVTYWFMASDIVRGIDIFKWTGPANPIGTPPPGQSSSQPPAAPTGVAVLAGAAVAALFRRRRRF